MWINWKRYTFEVFLLASLSLFLFGCSDQGGTSTATPTVGKTITGVVSDPVTGLPLAGAKIAAYAIDASGVQATNPLSVPATTLSDPNGKYVLTIPIVYEGALVVEANIPHAASKVAIGTMKQVSLMAIQTIRTVLPEILKDQTAIDNAMISFATEMMVQYIEFNKVSTFTPDNIKIATVMMEAYFGKDFTLTPPPANGAAATKPQQDLIVMIKAFNNVINKIAARDNTTIAKVIAYCVTVDANKMIGLGDYASDLKAEIALIQAELIANGTIPSDYTSNPSIIKAIDDAHDFPVQEPDPSNAPTYSISGSVSFKGSPLAGVTVAITGDGSSNLTTNDSGNYTFIAVRNGNYTVTPSVAGFTFTPASQSITVNNGNVTVPVFTATAILSTSYTISGRVSVNGAGLAGVTVAITGSGSSSLITDGSGNYSFTGVLNGNYTVTPSRTGYLFSPSSRTFAIDNANKPGQDFTVILGSATGGVTYPDGSVIGVMTYPNGTVTGGVTYPPGTIIGGISYPSGVVIGGVTYPTATVIGGVTYPTGVVIGGVIYPDGVVIGGVTYPAGTVVGGVAFPVGTVTGGVIYPTSSITATLIFL